jgi:UDP-N-acetylmuramate dehydrogenase
MNIQHNISLKTFNTFGIDVLAKSMASFSTTDQLITLLDAIDDEVIILGGGSNVLFTKNVDAFILKNEIVGMDVVKEDALHVYVRVGAGVNWHVFVQHCIAQNWCGVENLSLIPGNVGASPMQNIGAYGVELKDIFFSLDAYHMKEKKVRTFTLNDCAFGYRDSIFKKELKNEVVILDVTFRLNKLPSFNTSYGAIEEELTKMNVTELSIAAISQAVINIRSSKLPDPKVIGNAGSFFKNPTVNMIKYFHLKSQFEDIVGYKQPKGEMKLAAGWLVEQCGLKGYRNGDAGVHDKQALVLVNHGHAAGSDIFELSEKVIDAVKNKFNISLEREVNIY